MNEEKHSIDEEEDDYEDENVAKYDKKFRRQNMVNRS